MRIGAFFFCLSFATAGAQERFPLRFEITRLPSYHPATEKIYLAGSFNGWNPADERFRFRDSNGRLILTTSLPSGTAEFKLTRGSWEKVETGEEGSALANRRLKVEGAQSLSLEVLHWADHFPKKEKKHTATAGVKLLDSAFYMPQLDRHRRIWIYLPPGYSTSGKRYPVLYMHDGQNLFDEYTSAYGEWGVDEALDSLPPGEGMIVVGIDNSSTQRINEYAPYDMKDYGRGEGSLYVDFLVKTLKPYVDRHYRTQRKQNFIAGSSMGGLISFYALLRYPKTFDGTGVFSPAFWVTPQLMQLDRKAAKKIKGRIYFYAGRQESERMVPDMLSVFEQLRRYSKARITTVVRSEGRHDEATWRKEFPLFYKWIAPRKEDKYRN